MLCPSVSIEFHGPSFFPELKQIIDREVNTRMNEYNPIHSARLGKTSFFSM
jgi:hypothetical protein